MITPFSLILWFDTSVGVWITDIQNIEVKEPTFSETWQFKAADEIVSTGVNINETIPFTSNGHSYNSIDIDGFPGMIAIYYRSRDSEEQSRVNVWCSAPFIRWKEEGFRTIALEEPATGDLLGFLQANATKQ